MTRVVNVQRMGWSTLVSAGLGLGGLGLGAIAVMTPVVMASPVAAAELTEWRFDPTTHQLELKLSGTATPRYFLLAQPARIVLDLPSTQVGSVPEEQLYRDGMVRSVRVGQFQANLTRIVVELSPDAVFAEGQVELLQDGDRWLLRPLLVGDTPRVATATQAEPPSQSADITSEPAAEPVTPDSAPESLTLVEPGEELEFRRQDPGSDSAATSPDPTEVPTVADGSARESSEELPPLEPGAIELSVAQPDADRSDAVAIVDPVTLPDEDPEAIAIPNSETVESIPASIMNSTPASVIDGTVATPVPDPNVLDATVSNIPQQSAYPVPPESTATTQEAADPSMTSREDATATAIAPEPESIPVVPDEEPASIIDSHEQLDLSDEQLATLPPASIPPQGEISVQVPDLDETLAELQAAEESVAESPTPSPTPFPTPNATATTERESEFSAEFGQPIDNHEVAATIPSPENISPQPSSTIIPSGTMLRLRYPGQDPLVLTEDTEWQEVLILDAPILNANGHVLVPAGSPVIGRFETRNGNSQFVMQALALQDQNIPLAGESEALTGDRTSQSSLNNAAITVVSNLASANNNLRIVGGTTGLANPALAESQAAIIQPNQIIDVRVTEDLTAYR